MAKQPAQTELYMHRLAYWQYFKVSCCCAYTNGGLSTCPYHYDPCLPCQTLSGAVVGYRVGMIFMPNDDKHEADAKQIIEDTVKAEGRCKIVGWRDVPVDSAVVGRFARVTQPRIKQVSLVRQSAAAVQS